jgi:LysM repeat protein
MFKKLSLVFIITLAAVLLLVSCQRAASQAPLTSLATPTGTSTTVVAGQTTPIGQVQMIGTTQMIQTMTAVYEQTHAIMPGTSLPTSTPVGTVSTPNTFTLITPTGVATTPVTGLTPVVIVPTATPGRPATYTLMPGEFPYCIARRFNVNQDELLTLNGLTGTNVGDLQAGTPLHIPQTGNPFVGDLALHPHPGTYTVSSANDTIYSIACYYGNIDPTQIIAANSLVSPYTLHINQTLTIP